MVMKIAAPIYDLHLTTAQLTRLLTLIVHTSTDNTTRIPEQRT